jgi:hypothetical protein
MDELLNEASAYCGHVAAHARDRDGSAGTIQSLSNAQKISVKFNPELPAGRAEVP